MIDPVPAPPGPAWPDPARSGIICAGNWIVDIVHTIDGWPRKSDLVHIRDEVTGVGGGAANVALGLAALGFDGGLYGVGLLGQDLHAEVVLNACRAAGIDTRGLCQTDRAATGHTHVMSVPGDSRTFFYHPGSNDLLDAADIPLARIAPQARMFYLGYINLLGAMDRLDAQGRTPGSRVLAQARALGMTTCVDLVSSDTDSFAPTVAASLPHIDILFLNEVEAGRATGLPITAPDDLAGLTAAAMALLAKGAGRVVLHTAAVNLWAGAGEPGVVLHRAAPLDPASILSPVGAGDAFCAGVIFGVYHGWDPARCLTLGHRAAIAAMRSATATGGIPPVADLLR